MLRTLCQIIIVASLTTGLARGEGFVWQGTGQLSTGPGEVVCQDPKGASAHTLLGMEGEALHLRAVVNAKSTEWVALVVDGDWAGDFFKNGKWILTLRATGHFELFTRGMARFASGPIPGAARENRVDWVINPVAKKFWLFLNRVAVVNGQTMPEGVDGSPSTFGVRFLGQNISPGVPSVREMGVSTAPADNKNIFGPGWGFIWKPRSVLPFYPAPGVATELVWDSEQEGGPWAYVVKDSGGSVVAQGKTKGEGRTHFLTLSLPRGYHELQFPELLSTTRSFGISVQPFQNPRGADGFFAVDAVLSQLVKDPGRRGQLIQVMAQSGFASVRERMSANRIQSAPDLWDASGAMALESLFADYQKAGMGVLEVCHDSLRHGGDLGDRVVATNLAAHSAFWKKFAQTLGPSLEAVETWNEVDQAEYSGNATADSYAAMHHSQVWAMVAGGFPQSRIAPVALTAHATPDYVAQLVDNGVYQATPRFHFHYYDAPEKISLEIEKFRRAMGAYSGIPVLVTEAGSPWRATGKKPDPAAGLAAAWATVMLSVEARAAGVEKLYNFCLPYYSEITRNFSLTDEYGAPLPSFDALRVLVALLGHRRYVGEYPALGFGVVRAFQGSGDILMVFSKEGGGMGSLPESLKYLAMDGREISLVQARQSRAPLVYGLGVLSEVSNCKQTPPGKGKFATADGAGAKSPGPQNKGGGKYPSPLILQLKSTGALAPHGAQGYRVARNALGQVRLPVAVWNLGNDEENLTLHLTIRETKKSLDPLAVKVSAGHEGLAVFALDLTGLYTASDDARIHLEIRGEGKDNRKAPHALVLTLTLERSLADLLGAFSKTERVKPLRLLHEGPKGLEFQGEITPCGAKGHLDLQKAAGRWARLRLVLEAAPRGFRVSGLVMRVKTTGNASSFFGASDAGAEYTGPSGAWPAGGIWQTVYLPLASLKFLRSASAEPSRPFEVATTKLLDFTWLSFSKTHDFEMEDLTWVGN